METITIKLPSKVSGQHIARAIDITLAEVGHLLKIDIMRNLGYESGSVVALENSRTVEIQGKLNWRSLFTFAPAYDFVGRIKIDSNKEYAQLEMESCGSYTEEFKRQRENFEIFLAHFYDNIKKLSSKD